MRPRRSNVERTATTRHGVVRVARTLFGEHGYPATTISAIATEACLTTGAIYHHWSGKEGLLEDVVDDLYRDLVRRIRDGSSPDEPAAEQLLRSGREFLEMCAETTVARLLLVEAPAALGYARWREIDDRWWLRPTVRLLEQARAAAGAPVPGAADDTTRSRALALLGVLTHLGRDLAVRAGPGASTGAARTYETMVRAAIGDP